MVTRLITPTITIREGPVMASGTPLVLRLTVLIHGHHLDRVVASTTTRTVWVAEVAALLDTRGVGRRTKGYHSDWGPEARTQGVCWHISL